MMLYQMLSDGDMGIRHINDVVPWFEMGLAAGGGIISRLHSPRVFKTHLPLTQLPSTARFIYLLRDPKDSCVSFFYHQISLEGMRVPLRDFVERFVDGRGYQLRHQHHPTKRDSRDRGVPHVGHTATVLRPDDVHERVRKFGDLDQVKLVEWRVAACPGGQEPSIQ